MFKNVIAKITLSALIIMLKIMFIFGAIFAVCIWFPEWGGDNYKENFSRFQATFFVMHDVLRHKLRYTMIAAGFFTFGADFLWSPIEFIDDIDRPES